MKYIIKLILILLLFGLGSEFYNSDQIFFCLVSVFIGICIFVSIINNASKDLGLDYDYNVYDKKHKTYYDPYYSDTYDNYNEINNNERKPLFRIVPEFNHHKPKNDIKEIETKNQISHNIIEIGDEIEIIVDDEEIEVDNTKKNKPIVHKSALVETIKPTFEKVKVYSTTTNTKKQTKKSDCILISNGEPNKSLESVYRVLYRMLGRQNLTVNQKYALLQSIFYVDIFSMSVVIYVDRNILERSGLNDSHLQKDIVTKWIKKILHDEEINVIFEDIGYTSLLNYYLDKQKLLNKEN